MHFLEAQAEIEKDKRFDARRTDDGFLHDLMHEQLKAYEESGKQRYVFLSGVKHNILKAGVITFTLDEIESSLNDLIAMADITATSEWSIEETTCSLVYSLWDSSHWSISSIDFNFDILASNFGFSRPRYIRNPFSPPCECSDGIIPAKRSQQVILDTASKMLFGKPFYEELVRVFSGPENVSVIGHPVHYLFQTNDTEQTENSQSKFHNREQPEFIRGNR